MTVTTVTSHDEYDGDNATIVFSTTWQFWDNDEVEVYKRVKSTGAETLQVEGTDYAIINHVAGGTGQITFAGDADGPPTNLEEVHIRRVSNLTQQKDFTPRTSFPAEGAEEALDRAALRAQEEANDRNERFLRIPITDIPATGAAPDMELPNKTLRAVANAVLGFNATTGDPVIVTGASLPSVTMTADGITLVTAANFATMMGPAILNGILNYDSGGGNLCDKISIDTLANRDAATAMGQGLFFASDDGRFYVNTGSAYVEMVIKQFSQATLPTPVTAGIVVLDTDNGIFYRDNSSALEVIRGPFPRGHLAGMKMTVVNTNDDVSISVGQCRCGSSSDPDITNAIISGAAIVKQLDTAGGWVEGTNQAGRPAAVGLAINTWYHVFVVVKLDGSVDAGFDTDIDATNLLGETTDYVNFRRVGSVLTDGSSKILDFIQSGDEFFWDAPTLGGDESTVTTTEVLFAAKVPPDIKPMAHLNVNVEDGGSNDLVYIYSPDTTEDQASKTLTPLGTAARGGNSADGQFSQVDVIVDANGDFATTATAAPTSFKHATMGWRDHLGRYD